MIERLISNLEKCYRDFEIWNEKKVTKSFENSAQGLLIDQVIKSETAVRVFKDGKTGFAFLSGEDFDKTSLLNNLELSLEHSSKDEHNVLPEPDADERQYGDIRDEVKKDDVLKMFQQMKDASKEMENLKEIERLFLSDEKTGITLYNSKVGFFEERFNKISLGAVIIVTKDDEDKIEWDFATEELLGNLDGISIIKRAYERGVRLLSSSPTYSGLYPVIFESRSACEFLEVLAKSFLAENVYKKKSLLSESLTFPEFVTIIEDPLLPQGNRKLYFDGEGIKAKRKELVKKGEVKNILYDSLYGSKMGHKSSGNSIRASITTPPKNGYSNIYLTGDKKNLAEETKSLNNVIAVTSLIGMHLVNPISGEISVGFEGYLLEKGEYKKALSNMLITGNIKELFRNITATGEDLTFYGSMGSPSILVRGMSVAGL